MQAKLKKLGYQQCGKADRLDPADPERFYIHEA